MTPKAARAATILALLAPCPAMARDAASLVLTHSALGAVKTSSGRAPALAPSTDAPAPTPVGPALPVSDAAGLGSLKLRTTGSDWAGGAFRLTAMRGRSAVDGAAAQSFPYRRFALVALGTELRQEVTGRDTRVQLFLRRKF